MTVEENVAFGLLDRKQTPLIVSEYLKLVGLNKLSKAYPSQLSGGMAQRCAIARALINHPGILLLNEPFGTLDAMTKIYLQEELLKIHKLNNNTISLCMCIDFGTVYRS